MGNQVDKRDFLPAYPDPHELSCAVEQIRQTPGIVQVSHTQQLQEQFARAGQGQAFIVQGGDCAERFSDATRYHVRAKIGSLLQTGFVISQLSSRPVVPVGRIAGQYAKPRTHDTEQRDGMMLPSYRGDAINSHVFTSQARTPDPQRLVQAIESAQTAYRYITELETSDFLSNTHALEWNTSGYPSPQYQQFSELVTRKHADGGPRRIYISHEALLPFYEQALTDYQRWNNGAHMLWVGERTRYVESPQMAYLATINNPIGVKLGPNASGSDIHHIMDMLNPDGVPGRLVFIPRMGVSRIHDKLPALLSAARENGRPVTWVVDPMHGNTHTIAGRKIRFLSDIISEIREFFQLCASHETIAGGLHIEFSGHNVTEIADSCDDLNWTHTVDQPLVDPRLNPRQLLEVAFATGGLVATQR